MNGDQFLFILFLAAIAAMVVRSMVLESRERAERIRVAKSIVDKSADCSVAVARLHGSINPAELRMRIYKMERDFARLEIALERTRTATIAQASYWP